MSGFIGRTFLLFLILTAFIVGVINVYFRMAFLR